MNVNCYQWNEVNVNETADEQVDYRQDVVDVEIRDL